MDDNVGATYKIVSLENITIRINLSTGATDRMAFDANDIPFWKPVEEEQNVLERENELLRRKLMACVVLASCFGEDSGCMVDRFLDADHEDSSLAYEKIVGAYMQHRHLQKRVESLKQTIMDMMDVCDNFIERGNEAVNHREPTCPTPALLEEQEADE